MKFGIIDRHANRLMDVTLMLMARGARFLGQYEIQLVDLHKATYLEFDIDQTEFRSLHENFREVDMHLKRIPILTLEED